MQKLILLFIITLAVTTSIFAQAGSRVVAVTAPIESAQYDSKSNVIQITGHLPTRCAASPHPSLHLDQQTGALILSVKAYSTNNMCMAMIGGAFDLAFDIRSLKYNLVELNLDTEATYVIQTADGSVTVTIDFSTVELNSPYATEEVESAKIEMLANGEFAVVTDNQIYEISSPFIEAQKYIGASVDVQGHFISVKTAGMDFSSAPTNKKPIFLVTGINTTTY